MKAKNITIPQDGFPEVREMDVTDEELEVLIGYWMSVGESTLKNKPEDSRTEFELYNDRATAYKRLRRLDDLAGTDFADEALYDEWGLGEDFVDDLEI